MSLGVADVIVAHIVADFSGYLHPATAAIPSEASTLTLQGHQLQPQGVRASDVKVTFVAEAGGCTPTAIATQLNNTAVTLAVAGFPCASPGAVVAYLTVAQKPAQKQPVWLETGASVAYDAHNAKGALVGHVLAPLVYASTRNMARNAQRLVLRGEHLPTNCSQLAHNSLFFSHFTQAEPGLGQSARVRTTVGPSCDFEAAYGVGAEATLCGWTTGSTGAFSWDRRYSLPCSPSPA